MIKHQNLLHVLPKGSTQQQGQQLLTDSTNFWSMYFLATFG